MRAGPGLAPRVPARCSPAPSLADAGSEPLLHSPAARKDLPRVRPPEGGAPRVRAPAPRPGGLARCSPQRRQGASCDLRGRGAGAGVRPGVGPGTQAIPAPAPAAPPGRERAPSRGLRARAARWERRPSRNRRRRGMGVARPPGFLGVAQDPPLRLPAAPSRALCPPPRTGRGSPLGGPPLPRRRSPWKPGG